jgi:hypothetical protein
MPRQIEPCDAARERYGPGKRFRFVDFDRHVKSCKQCTSHQRQLARAQRTRTTYSRDYPLTGDVHRYLLIAPKTVWSRAQRRAADDGGVSMRLVLNSLLEHYATHGAPLDSVLARVSKVGAKRSENPRNP